MAQTKQGNTVNNFTVKDNAKDSTAKDSTGIDYTVKGYTVKDNGKIDFDNPPEGKRFVPVPTTEEDIKLRRIDRKFVTRHKFSATTKLVVMELIDEEEYDSAKAYTAQIKTECREHERRARCLIRSPKTGKEIYCPECISCYGEECPMKKGMVVRTWADASLDEMEDDLATTVKSSVYSEDPTADEAIGNADWSIFKEKLREEDPILVRIIEWDEYGYERDEILKMLGRKGTEKSWYYYQWKRIRDRWIKYNKD